MPENNTFKGAGVALVTPFNEQNEVDIQALQRIIEHVIEGGIDYIVALGTTSETPTLSHSEKIEVLSIILETTNKRVPVVAGLGGNNTAELSKAVKTLPSGIVAILSVAPYYNRPSQEGLYRHYAEVASATSLPLLLYNVPSRTGSNMNASTTLRLAVDFQNIIGIKEASGDLTQVMHLIQNRPDDFLVISGDDLLTLPMLALGADGLISVMANALPSPIKHLVHSGLTGNFKEAAKHHYRLLNLIEALFEEGNPAGIKILLQILGLGSGFCRLPLLKASPALQQRIETLIALY